MKYIAVFLVLLFSGVQLIAQEKAVPKNIINTFKKTFKSTESPSWYVEREYYEVQFLQKGTEKVVHFGKANGEVILIKELIQEDQIPGAVMKTVRDKYPGYILQEYARLTRSKESPVYALSIEVQEDIIALEISSEGEEIK